MYMGSPYTKAETLFINEATGRLPGVPRRRIRALAIDYDEWSVKSPKKNYAPELAAINALLAKLPEPSALELFAIQHNSKLKQVPDIGRFKNLRHLHIGGSKVSDFEPIHQFNQLDSLFLIGYEEEDLQKFKGLRADYFRAIRGSLTHIDAKMTEGCFQNCSKLVSLDGAKARKLELEACKRIDHDTMSGVRGLKCLILSTSSAKSLTAMDFVSRCSQLEYLGLEGAHFNAIDYSALPQSKSLKYLTTVVKDSLLREVAAANPRKVVHNHDLCLKGNIELEDMPADPDDYECDYNRALAAVNQ